MRHSRRSSVRGALRVRGRALRYRRRGARADGAAGVRSHISAARIEMYQPPDFHGNPAVRRPVHVRAHPLSRLRALGWPRRSGLGARLSGRRREFREDSARHDRGPPVRAKQGPIVGSALVALDDPALFKYPVSYMSEPGGWHPNDKEVAGFRTYLLKGGFMIFDDFREGWRGQYDWTNLRQEMSRAHCRTRNGCSSRASEPIFDSFFKIDIRRRGSRPRRRRTARDLPTYWGVYEDNDPKKRTDHDRQRRQRHRRVVAVVGAWLRADRRGERDVQAGHQLRDLRADALTQSQSVNVERPMPSD